MIDAYADTGADLIELGVPYSDPLADGPVIHAAATEALAAGTTFDDAWRSARASRPAPGAADGLRQRRADARGRSLRRARSTWPARPGRSSPTCLPGRTIGRRGADERGLAPIGFITPTTAPERLERIAAGAIGFTYVVSLTGVTGERAEVPPELAAMVAAVRSRLACARRRRVRDRHAGARGHGRRDGRRGDHRHPAGPRGRRCGWSRRSRRTPSPRSWRTPAWLFPPGDSLRACIGFIAFGASRSR